MLRNRNYFLRFRFWFRFRLLTSYGSGSDFGQVPVPVPHLDHIKVYQDFKVFRLIFSFKLLQSAQILKLLRQKELFQSWIRIRYRYKIRIGRAVFRIGMNPYYYYYYYEINTLDNSDPLPGFEKIDYLHE